MQINTGYDKKDVIIVIMFLLTLNETNGRTVVMRLDDKEMGFVDGAVTPDLEDKDPKVRIGAIEKIKQQEFPDQVILEKVAMGNCNQGDRLDDRYWEVRVAAVGGLDKTSALNVVREKDGHFQVRDAAKARMDELRAAVEMVQKVQKVKIRQWQYSRRKLKKT
ncbi:MAG: hypothetical protein KAI76_07940 [Alphaproteobacteria bacterium]|nr:hypothetical protein [Alphaproteobacteria bacterium]